MKYLVSIAFLCIQNTIMAQSDISLTIDVSADTIYMDNAFKIEYKVENGSASGFELPELPDFDLLQGPSRSSSMTFINGVQSSEESYSYYFRPTKSGTFVIQPFELTKDGKTMTSNSPKVVVVPNPNNLLQDPNTGQIEGRPLPKKKSTKRKRFRI